MEIKQNQYVLIIIEHFLSKEGKDYFETWIEKVQSKINSYDGYLSIQRIFDVQSLDRTLICLKFKKLSQLKAWSTTDDHKEVLKLIEPFQEKKQKSQIFSSVKSEK